MPRHAAPSRFSLLDVGWVSAGLAVVGVVLLVNGVLDMTRSTRIDVLPAPAAAAVVPSATPAVPSPSVSTAPTPATVEEGAPDPVRLRIPAIGVDAGVGALGHNRDRTLEVPTDPAAAGWFRPGPEPGEQGAAVVAGHVDSWQGPGVFFRLGELQPGAEVEIEREDGTVRTFRVDRVEQHPKDGFPTDAVYGVRTGIELRLITCGGLFDRGVDSYEDNIIAFATAVD